MGKDGKLHWDWGTPWEAKPVDHEAYAAFVKELNGWRKESLHDALQYGRMVKPLDISCGVYTVPTYELYYPAFKEQGKSYYGNNRSYSSIITNAYEVEVYSMNEQLKNALQGELQEYRSIPFWSWNSALDEGVLVKQIEDMKAAGIGGFIMHARTGLKDEYLGEKWMSCIDACLKKARELDMEAWIYDENGWPSGFVGGKLLDNEDFRARFLEYATGAFDRDAYAVFVADEVLGYRRVEAPVAGVCEYHNVYLRISPANTDILNPHVVDAFIEETHEQYYARFKECFGRELAGFFTDEPQFYRWATPYTPCAEPYFDDIRDGLIWLFVQDERGYPFRLKYYDILCKLFTQNFYKKLYDWCEDHHCMLTGHSVEESALYAQMWGCADIMPAYEFEHMPGIDALGKWNIDELSMAQVSSVACQMGKRFILTETYGCAGYDVTPMELRSIGQAQYFQGVNRMCHHLYPYSLAGQGKTDHPPVFGPQGNWGKGFKIFNDYFARLSYLIANTKPVVDVGIINPVRQVWMDYLREEDRASVLELENAYTKLINADLRAAGVNFHILDEDVMERHGSASDGKLHIGQMSYDTVLVPKMKSLASSTYRLLQDYTGKLCVLETPRFIDGQPAIVELRDNLTFEALLQNRAVPFSSADHNCYCAHRKGDIGEFLFIKNMSMTEAATVQLDCWADYSILDLETFQEHPAAREMTMDANGSLILVHGACNKRQKKKSTVDVTDKFAITNISQNYLVLDYAQIAKKGGEFGGKYPLVGLMENLLREDYKGEITVRQCFTVEKPMPLTLLMEKTVIKNATVNGQVIALQPSEFDVNFLEAEIGDFVQAGENEFTYTFDFWQHEGVHFALFDPMATESLRNCLYYDTTMESAYIRGDFAVDENHTICCRKSLPALTDQLQKEGYPFFMGTVTVEGNVTWDGCGSAELAINGRFQVAEIAANGRETVMVLDNKRDITDILEPGENRICITLRSSLRNLFGPHHYAPAAEPMSTNPGNFTMRGSWGEGVSPLYTHTYNSVPFGVEAISMTVGS